MSGFFSGLRDGYKAVCAPGYDGALSAFGKLETDHPSKDLNAFLKLTKPKEHRETAQIQEEEVRVALRFAGSGDDGFRRASFFLDSLLHGKVSRTKAVSQVAWRTTWSTRRCSRRP